MDIRGEPGAGTHLRYHYRAQGDSIVPFFSYYESDLLPRLHCCVYSYRNCSNFLTFRNATICAGYKPPSPGKHERLLSCQPRVTVMSCFVYKVIRH